MSTEREYTPPIMLGAGWFEIDTTPDGEGDLEICSHDGDHVAYLDATDQMTLRDLLNRLHPLEPRQVSTEEELDALPPGSVVLSLSYLGQPSGQRISFQRWADGDWHRGARSGSTHPDNFLPATVLHVGGGRVTAVECCSGCPDCGPSATKRTVEAITGRVGKVSDGPWTAWDRGIGYEVHGPEGEPINSRHRETFSRGDAEFIAMAPGDVHYLLAELRKRDEALERVERLATGWHLRGESDMAFSKTLPDEDIAMAILTDGAAQVENARHIRNALKGDGA